MKTVRPLRGDPLAGVLAVLPNRRLAIGQKDKVSLRTLRLCGELLPEFLSKKGESYEESRRKRNR